MNTTEMTKAIARIVELNTKMEEMEAFGQVRLHADVKLYSEMEAERDALLSDLRETYNAMPKLVQAGWSKRIAVVLS